jgi:hypothetical protein
LVVDSVEKSKNQINTSTANQHSETQICCTQTVPNSWYDNIKFYLLHRTAPHNLDPKNRITLRLKSASFQLINDVLFQKNFDSVFLRCLEKEESERVLDEIHFGGDTTAHNVLRAGYYWPTLFKDAHTLSCKCIICQKAAG